MSAPEPESPPTDFFAEAVSLGLLPASVVDGLRRRCAESGQPPAQFIATTGLLDAVDIDIVETVSSATDVIPGYRIERLIGKGGMGVVYQAEQRNLGRTVALKTILVSRMADRGVLDRFEREARSIGQLRHPNIIAAHDFGRHAGRVFLAMELVDGIDLDHRIERQGPLDERLAWGIARQAAAGLAHAAQQHIVHRDVKPANLLLVPPPEGYPLPPGMPMVKIADFGLALLESDGPVDSRLTAPDSTVGSPHYMAPEQLESSDVDIRADMYALGATLFHALTGRPPFSGMKLSQLIAAKMGTGAAALHTVRGDLSAATCRLVDRLLARDRNQRPGNYLTLITEIDALLHELGGANAGSIVPAIVETVIPNPDAARSAVTATMQSVRTPPALDLRIAQPATGPVVPAARRSRRIWLAAFAVLISFVAFAAWWTLAPRLPPLPTTRGDRAAIGDVAPLFFGVTIDGWKPVFGNWGPAADDAVLAGHDGVIERLLPTQRRMGVERAPRPDDPPLYYRLDLILQPLAQNAAAEVHFGLTSERGQEPTRYVLRRDATGLVLGTRAGDRGEFTPEARIVARPIQPDAAAAVEIERLPSGWFVDVDGRPFGAVPLETHPQPLFRLAAEGEARFAELYLQALQTQTVGAAH